MAFRLRSSVFLRISILFIAFFVIASSYELVDALSERLPFSQTNPDSEIITYDRPGAQTFVVPEGVTSIGVLAWGAGGGGGSRAEGGGGGFATSPLTVEPGDNLTVYVGMAGKAATSSGVCGAKGAEGGEASYIEFDGELLLLAGGGGGAGAHGLDGSGGNGGAGGGELGLAGSQGNAEIAAARGQGGEGGSQTTGGTGGSGGDGDFRVGPPGASGSYLTGGLGGYSGHCGGGGGSGGDGYFGGGGGGSGGHGTAFDDDAGGGGGGGGSSFAEGTVAGNGRLPGWLAPSGVSAYGGLANVDGGHGLAQISWSVPVNTPTPTFTFTSVPPTNTATHSPTPTATSTNLPPSSTATTKPTNTSVPSTNTPTATAIVQPTATSVPTTTPLPPDTPTGLPPISQDPNRMQGRVSLPLVANQGIGGPPVTPTPEITVSPTAVTNPGQGLLKPLEDQQVPLGSTLRLTLANGDPTGITFNVSPLPLFNNAMLNAKTGEFLFVPSPEQIGSFRLTFSATNGQKTESKTITISVPSPDPNAQTALRGRILDANDAEKGITTPLVGATVRHIETDKSVTTDNQGYFTLSGLNASEQYIEFNGATASPVNKYGAYRSQQKLTANVTNVIDRPIYIMAIDTQGQTQVDPNQETIVQNPNIDTTITIPPHTVMDDNDNEYSGPISVSEVPDDFTPSSLPDTLDPGMVLTIQPMGLTFNEPAPITFPNFDNLPPRSVVDIWSMDHETSQFFVAGKGRVSNDGSVIETIQGGIRESSWHFPSARQPDTGPSPEDPGDNNRPPDCPVSSKISLADGCLSTSIDLPSYISLGQTRGLSFVYNSQTAYPQPIFSINADSSDLDSPIPNQLSYSLSDLGGVGPALAETYLDVNDLSRANRRFRAATTIDGTQLETRVLPYTMRVTQHYETSSVAAEFTERKIIVNEQNSPFGAGWGLAGLQRIFPQQDGSLLLTNGEGSALVFDSFDIGIASLGAGRSIDFSLASGSELADARTAIDDIFADESIQQLDVSTLSAKHLRHTDVLFASVRRQNGFLKDNVITPLTEAEQDALFEFVSDGGCAILMVSDNLGDDDLPIVNQSFVDPFGMKVEGYYSPNADIPITDPSASSIASGPFGEVTAMKSVGIVGGITNLGPYAKSLASTPIGSALAVIEPNAISSGSGGVVVLASDIMFDSGARFANNQTLFLNSLNLCLNNVPPTAETHYDGPDGDFTRIIQASEGTFTRYMKNGTEYRFNVNGLQSAMVDRNGNTTTFSYDNEGRLTQIADPVGKTTTLTYGGNRLKSVTDPTGRITQFTHDSAGNLTQVTLPDNSVQTFGYDNRHLMTSETDRRGLTLLRVYDAQGRINSASLPENVTRELVYSQSSGLAPSDSGTESNPATLVLAADVNSSIADGEGRETSYQLGPIGRPVQITDPTGYSTTIQRDADGNATRIIPPSRGDIHYSYDVEGNVIEHTDESWSVLDNQYSYDTYSGAVTSITDWGGNVATFTYDSNGNLTQAMTPLGREASLTYDSRGLPQTLIDQLGTESRFTYNEIGNPTQIMIGADEDSRSTTMTYTPEGYVQNVTDPSGRVYRFSYDPLGRLTSETLPGNRTVAYAYDNEDNLTSVTPPGQPAHLFEYDGLGQVTAYVPPTVNGSVTTRTTYSYNQAQQLTNVTHPDGKEIVYRYDEGGRLTEQTQPRGTTTFQYGFSYGTLNSVTSPNGVTLRYGYQGDRIDAVTWVGPVAGYVGTDLRPDGVLGNYNINAGQSGNRHIFYTHDADDALVEAGQMKLAYGETSGLLSTTTLDDINDDRQYNAFGEMGNYEAIHGATTSLYKTAYLYDSLGRITTITETVQGVTKTLAYNYDEAGRLSSVAENGPQTASYTYDANGNRLTGPGGATGTYDAQDRLLTYGNASYTYTANGELLTKKVGNQTTTYNYDVMGNLMGVDLPDGTQITYLVDGQNRRIGKRVNGVLQYGLLYKDQLNPVAKLKPDGNIDQLYIYGSRSHVPDYISSRAEDNSRVQYRLITNHLGSVRLVVNAQTSEVMQEIEYDAWGKVTKDTNPGFQPFGFAGGIYDPDVDLVRFGARDYDPDYSRWTVKDPVGFMGGNNLYTYSANDPINNIDVDGNDWIAVGGGIVAGGIAVVVGASGAIIIATAAGVYTTISFAVPVGSGTSDAFNVLADAIDLSSPTPSPNQIVDPLINGLEEGYDALITPPLWSDLGLPGWKDLSESLTSPFSWSDFNDPAPGNKPGNQSICE